jgi:hypothetical protein
MAIDYGQLSDSLAIPYGGDVIRPQPFGSMMPPGFQPHPWSATGGVEPTGAKPPGGPTGPLPGIIPNLRPPGGPLGPLPGVRPGMRPPGSQPWGPMPGRRLGGQGGPFGQTGLLEQLMALLGGQQQGGGDVWQQLLQHFLTRGGSGAL